MYNCFAVSTLLFAALMSFVSTAAEPTVTRAPAADAAARVPEARYESAFAGYVPYQEQKPAPWRDVNDEVRKAGGHISIIGGTHAQHGARPANPSRREENKK